MEKKIKICLILNYAPHYRKAIFTLIDNEFDCKFIFGDIFNKKIKKLDYSLLKDTKEVHTIPIGSFYWQKNIISTLFKQYDHYIIIGEPYGISSWIFMLFGKILHKSIYTWGHGWYGRESKIKSIVKKVYLSLSKANFVYGNYARNIMIEKGTNPQRVITIYNSLDYDTQLKQRKIIQKNKIYEDHFKNQAPNIIFIGRLTISKKLEMLLDLTNKAKNNGKNINLILIGDGEDKENLQSLSSQYNINDIVWFYGACYDEHILANLIYNADLCVCPGAIGLTAIHCLTFGCPVITHDDFKNHGPEFEAIKKGITGDFFKYNDANSLYKTVILWFEKNKDRNSVRKAAYNEVDTKWNPHNQIRIFKEIFQKKK